MNQKSNNKTKTIFGIILVIIIILCAIYVEWLNKENSNNIYENIDIDTSKLNIFYFNVGQADSTLIIYKDKTMLIDAGNDSDGEEISKFIKAKGIKHINYLIGTHIDGDHIGGIDKIIKEFEIGTLYMPKTEEQNNKEYNQVIAEMEGKITNPEVGNEIELGDAKCVIKWIDNNTTDTNNSSIVVQLNYKEQKYLFMGDVEEKVEKSILKKLEKIDVLKVAHHGSNSSTSEEFLNKTNPKYAIISSGSSYDLFPNENMLKRILKYIDARNIFFTERDGTLWIKSNGEEIIINELPNVNLDGAGSKIDTESLNKKHLEDIKNKVSSLIFVKI